MTRIEGAVAALALGVLRWAAGDLDDGELKALVGAAAIKATDQPPGAPIAEATRETVDRGVDILAEWLEPRVDEALS